MSEPIFPPDPNDERLGAVIAAYLTAVEAGQAPNIEELLAQHPDVADQLAAFFANEERFQRLVAPLHSTAVEPVSQAATGEFVERSGQPGDPTLDDGPGHGGSPTTLPKGVCVRYVGDYELQKVLGEGGMGVVYRAKQLSLNRVVAVKMIRAGHWAGDEEVRRFKNEAEAVAGLDHPQIVPIYEIGAHEGQHYFSMKLVGDASLAGQLPRHVADPKAAARLVAEVARAVHH